MAIKKVEKDLTDYLVQAISDNYFITAIITSYTQAKNKTDNLPFGLGKTTLALWLSYYLNGNNWDKVFETLYYNPYALAVGLEPSTARKYCGVWDDVQATAPAMQGIAKPILKLANFLTTERPEIALLLFTAPNVNMIAAPLRKLINFEIIVSERGYYEVHKITFHKNFKKPMQDRARLEYLEELAQDTPFPPLPQEIQQRYDMWRTEQKLLLYPSLLNELKNYIKLQQWNKDMKDIPLITGRVIRAGHAYMVQVPDSIGKELHMRQVELAITASPNEG